jgi:hypothetical protein
LLATGGLGYVVILFHRLFLISPYLPLLPAVLIALVLYVMFLNGNSRLSLAMTHPIQEDETAPEEKEKEDEEKQDEEKNNEVSVDPPLLGGEESFTEHAGLEPCLSVDQSQFRTLDESALEGFLLAERLASQIEGEPFPVEDSGSFDAASPPHDSQSSSLSSSALIDVLSSEDFSSLAGSALLNDFWLSSSSSERSQREIIPSQKTIIWEDNSSEEDQDRRMAEAVESFWDSD